MARALSVDLRRRVVAAISEGMSCRQAAIRFGVSAASAIRWWSLKRSSGSVAPKALGGDRRSERIEAHAGLILGLVERASDITLKEIRAELAEAGVAVGIGTLWRFFARRRRTWKKTRPAKLAGRLAAPGRPSRRRDRGGTGRAGSGRGGADRAAHEGPSSALG